ncbi:RNA polymerase sigma-70 factor, ECF subfamily [Filimonas lacunae]|uniref:RNA polymerase sigma-70 factor, ECF subfamily n=1 Tax=Filimonas lacunae TaxID=477680 RepID=A0A173MHK2_9BACT|nr:RNA polymerase sigma-70 factor [Filimonas lacunae]BAV06898.1 RNA polymerase ECF-type sigma factor [Filimonas lacunae]SIS98136.1 RNA polymerase sigma-70 factor, ECF subfamily [Filimonas lacunae]
MPFVPPYNEPELLLCLSKGDPDAYRALFEQYWDAVYAIALKLCKQPELAKDLAQESFIKIWNHRDKLTGVTHFTPFLFTLTRHLVIDHLRRKVFTVGNEAYLTAYFSDDAGTPQEKAEYKELEHLLNRAVNSLPPQMQQVFRLSRFEGLSHAEIALRMNITRVTSKSYMVRALNGIRQYLSQYSDEQYLLPLLLCLLLG